MGMPERFPRHQLQRKPFVSGPGMHHGTCVTHVLWCMSGSLTRFGGENVPGIPGACATLNFMYLARGPWEVLHWIKICVSSCRVICINQTVAEKRRVMSGTDGFPDFIIRYWNQNIPDKLGPRLLMFGSLWWSPGHQHLRYCPCKIIRARFLSLVWSKLRLCPANHRPRYWSKPSTAWA